MKSRASGSLAAERGEGQLSNEELGSWIGCFVGRGLCTANRSNVFYIIRDFSDLVDPKKAVFLQSVFLWPFLNDDILISVKNKDIWVASSSR